MTKKLQRELDRNAPSTNSDDDFASSGPFELFTLVILTCIFAVIDVSLPRLLSRIYGATATQLYRPTIVVLGLGFVIACKPRSRKSSGCVLLMVITAITWALCMMYGAQIFNNDIKILERIVRLYNTVVGQLGTYADRPYLPSALSTTWIPVIGSSVIEALFQGSLTTTMVSILRERSRRTKLPTVFLMSALFIVGFALSYVLGLYSVNGTHCIFYSIVALALLGMLNVRTWQALLICSISILATLGILTSTTTLSCAALPGILKCPPMIGNFTIRAHSESVTGHISVIDNDKYRLLKADHSLLGGEWQGQGTGQSIFTAFYMQSLAVYAFTEPRDDFKVLQIGLGIGTATKTLLESAKFAQDRGKVEINVVELDPKVIEYAHSFFNLPLPALEPRLRIQAIDALKFVEQAKNDTYDLISHDIFTGGSLTFSLFTFEFFEQLKAKLTKGGILTVNYVYSPSLAQQSFESVGATLKAVFAEVIIYIETGKLAKINNLVFFCSDTKMSLQIPDSGREPTSNLGQTARNMPDWQFSLPVPFDASFILHEEWIDLGTSRFRTQEADTRMALEHWRFMRDLLPEPENRLWTTY